MMDESITLIKTTTMMMMMMMMVMVMKKKMIINIIMLTNFPIRMVCSNGSFDWVF